MAVFVLDGQHHSLLIVGVICGADARLSAQTGKLAVTTDNEGRFERLTAFQHQAIASRSDVRLHMTGASGRKHGEASLFGGFGERHARPAVLGHIAQSFAVILG